MSNIAINIRDVIKIFEHKLDKTKISALRGCDLSIKQGELVSVIGPSGAGKTTLLRVIAGIEPVSSGRVEVGGVAIHDWNEARRREFRRRFIGSFTQHSRENLDPRMKAVDAIIWETVNAGWDTSNARTRAREILEELEINELANQRCGNLSAGEAMRISLAKAVAKKPFIILADEPTGQLDTENMILLYDLMKRIVKTRTAILVATHDIRLQGLSSRALLILDGRLATEEHGAELLARHETFIKLGAKEETILSTKALLDSSYSFRIPDNIRRRLKINRQVILTHVIDDEFARIQRNPDEVFDSIDSEKTSTIIPFSRDSVMNTPIIKAVRLGKTYQSFSGNNEVLKDLSFSIEQGDFVVILGPSGVGKTTLLNLFAGLEAISCGSLEILGEFFHEGDFVSSRVRLNHINYVSQHYMLHPFLSVAENAMLPKMLHEGTIKDQKLIFEMLGSLGLKKYAKVYPTELSGGQQQRVALAAALLKGTDLLLTDEPTANLDSRMAIQVMNIMTRLAEQEGKTIIAATHDYMLVRPGYRIIRLENKAIKEDVIADEDYCQALQAEFLKEK
ncbi:MAG: ABC transporter ATP-binding protein [Candidatus Hodarchaeales archaeon]